MTHALRSLAALSLCAAVAAVACGTETNPSVFGDTPTAGSSSKGKGGTGGKAGAETGQGGDEAGGSEGEEGGTGGTVGSGGSVGIGGSVGTGGTGVGGSESCGGDSVEATPTPLDLFIMLDQSGSMGEIAEGTTTKWKSVGLALGTFMTDKRSVGIGAGLQYFPSQNELPSICSTDAQCKGKGTCGFGKACDKLAPDGNRYICADDESCQNSGVVGGKCVTDTSAKECVDSTCVVEDYATPDVPITEIPAAIDLFATSLAKHKPLGGTPTGPALQGAIEYATKWAADHPDHKVAVVLATDGLPTQCAPVAKETIAAHAAKGRPAVDTYVIGVFAKTANLDLVKTNLNHIAQAGADRDAFLITTGGNAAKEFADAMAEIRTAALPCDFAIPPQSGGTAIDYGKVNVDVADPAGNKSSLGYATNEEGCNPDDGGWYYDADPKMGGEPTQVKLCPASCTVYRSQAGMKIATVFGCETVIVPPPK